MNLYETIFSRRTVRRFDMSPLDDATLQDVLSFTENTTRLSGQNARFQLAEAGEVNDKSAPHYLLAYCADNASAYANVGYVLAKTELYLQSKGYGSHWLGMAKPNTEQNDFCILMAFGKTNEPVRKSVGEFKRLAVSEIGNVDNKVVNAARLAPSAMNKQPWKIGYSDQKIVVDTVGRGIVNALLPKKWSNIGLGIVTMYLQIALENEGKEIQSIKTKTEGKTFSIEIILK